MALIKYNKDSLLNAIIPGLNSIVANEFSKTLEKKLNTIVQEVYKELYEALPKTITLKVEEVLGAEYNGKKVQIVVDLRGFKNV